jgi:transcriptional regulator with XRE-family HTH domain
VTLPNSQDWSGFWDWVEQQRKRADVSWYRLEELAGVGNGVISSRARANLKPTIENMEGISRALGIELREILAQAGFIQPVGANEPDDSLAGLLHLARTITPAERRELLDYLKWHYRRDLIAPDSPNGITSPENKKAKSVG